MIDRDFEQLLAEERRQSVEAHRRLDLLDERIEQLKDKLNHQDAGLIGRDTPSL